MYTDNKSVQILISLLKRYNINTLVIAPGTRHMPLVHSVENDPFFDCYSITDERSAGYFALGLIQELNKPVAICCTSGTASINFLSAANEACFQRLPLLILTGDRSSFYLDQYEDQMAPTNDLFSHICKKSVTLPIVQNETDSWRCQLSINQCLSELEYNYPGPVNINFQVTEHDVFSFNTPTLPRIEKIDRYTTDDIRKMRNELLDQLYSHNRIAIIYGQNSVLSDSDLNTLNSFVKQFNCVIFSDNISNLHSDFAINLNNTLMMAATDSLRKLQPDLIISLGGHSVANYSKLFNEASKNTKHWLINTNGEFIDSYRRLQKVFKCSDIFFFEELLETNSLNENLEYFNSWLHYSNKFPIPTFEYSDIYAVQQLFSTIPNDSLLHISNSISIRYSQFFNLHNSIKISCNRGCNGIDGSMSTFIGASNVSEKLCFLLIGDLSFFYDLNGLWNKYIGKNIRILLNNNFGGMIFNSTKYWKPYKGVNEFIAAEHDVSAKNWCESRNFTYYSASNRDELDHILPSFISDVSDNPIILEVFTNKESNNNIFTDFVNTNREVTFKRVVSHLKKKVSITS